MLQRNSGWVSTIPSLGPCSCKADRKVHVEATCYLKAKGWSSITGAKWTECIPPTPIHLKSFWVKMKYLPLPRRLCFHPRLSVGWIVCLSVGLHKNYWTHFHGPGWEDGTWASKEPVTFSGGSGQRGRCRKFFYLFFLLQCDICKNLSYLGDWYQWVCSIWCRLIELKGAVGPWQLVH